MWLWVAPLAGVLEALAIDADLVAVAVTLVSDQAATGIASYFGLDHARALASGWDPWVVALHEIGHAFGLHDRPLATGSESLYGYAAPHAGGLTADAVEFVQRDLGASGRDDRIEITGHADGSVSGGRGADTVHGGAGNAILYGNQENDVLLAVGGDDILFGGQGDDRLGGGEGADVLYGNLADDILTGGAGSDRLYGGQGDDEIFAGAGDTVWGGVGADTLWVHPLTVIGQHDPADTIYFVGV